MMLMEQINADLKRAAGLDGVRGVPLAKASGRAIRCTPRSFLAAGCRSYPSRNLSDQEYTWTSKSDDALAPLRGHAPFLDPLNVLIGMCRNIPTITHRVHAPPLLFGKGPSPNPDRSRLNL